MTHKKSFVFLGLLVACSVYSYWLSNKDFEWIVPHMNARAPAAIKDSKDFQQVLDKPMRVFKREAVVDSIMIDTHAGRQKFSMGQFAVKTAGGQNLVCLEYPFVRLHFIGEGMSMNGKQARVRVAAPCQIHPRNRDMMTDIPLPFEELYRRPAQQQEFKMNDSMFEVDIQVDNTLGDWPRWWQLERIEFYRDPSSEDNIVVTKDEILKTTGEPILVKAVNKL